MPNSSFLFLCFSVTTYSLKGFTMSALGGRVARGRLRGFFHHPAVTVVVIYYLSYQNNIPLYFRQYFQTLQPAGNVRLWHKVKRSV